MKRLSLIVGLAGIAAASQAAINLNLNAPYQTAVIPGSGSIFVTFSGTVDVLIPTFDVTSATIEWPSNGSTSLPAAFDAGFLTYLGGNSPGVDYTGALFTIEVSSTTTPGLYWLNGNGFSQLSEFWVDASDGVNTARDQEIFGVNVVPEPGTIAALGIGAAALLRRRRKA